MANSQYEVVKQFERENYLLQDTHIVIRVDGRGFHRFTKNYDFSKPNDERALKLMNKAAHCVMESIPDTVLAYGDSDEYSFLLRKDTDLFERREAKLVSTFVSSFTSYYIFYWNDYFVDKKLNLDDGLPTFDGRAVLYPNIKRIRQYFSWRQVDCHINNLYNTTFWTLVIKGGLTPQDAENKLMGTFAKDKNEILFSEFGINYNNEPEIFKKGTVIVRESNEVENVSDALNRTSLEEQNTGAVDAPLSLRQKERRAKKRRKMKIQEHHADIIGDTFWHERSYLFE
ncbi:tRNA guanylyltransferase [Saccharomycopsis crataegensis]|uniref:tRNA(His) guanylyltransferase n=1 Tax=Saccharomycopsis crataegensis TaxID=43959 RepID=A0AAV5QL39_9ASCO|nr:tRNA guanylyltransferase [Saccharomycopsis crataegensis]